tara:strand:+ start:247 stop:597 length:351 start_codon:yes stop_codon:yes gene_type:complete
MPRDESRYFDGYKPGQLVTLGENDFIECMKCEIDEALFEYTMDDEDDEYMVINFWMPFNEEQVIEAASVEAVLKIICRYTQKTVKTTKLEIFSDLIAEEDQLMLCLEETYDDCHGY